jgi:LacI family transcriptional regulator
MEGHTTRTLQNVLETTCEKSRPNTVRALPEAGKRGRTRREVLLLFKNYKEIFHKSQLSVNIFDGCLIFSAVVAIIHPGRHSKRFGGTVAVTIRDLAEKLHLSITTVSRALDGYQDVAEETRERVVRAAQEMGYEPSFAARQLRRKRSDAIGYILPTSSPQFSDPFYINFLTGLCDEVATFHRDLLVTSCPPDSEKEKDQYRQWTLSHRVDGMVLNRTRLDDWRVNFLLENKIPFVSLGKGNTTTEYPYIDILDCDGFKALIVHLVKKGHQRIAYIGAHTNLVVQADRFRGYQEGLAASGIPFDADLVKQGDLTEEGGYRTALELLQMHPRPTAILGCNDLTALGVVRAAKDRGIYIGTELAIAGYDGIKETEFTNPPLTTLYQPTYEIARMLARMLIQVVNGAALEETCVTIRPRLIIRASTG